MAETTKNPLVSFTHDLNNLLVGIDGYGRLLAHETDLSHDGKIFLRKLLDLVGTATEKSVEFQKQAGLRKHAGLQKQNQKHGRDQSLVLEKSEYRALKQCESAPSSAGDKAEDSLSTFRILVIDDDPYVRKSIQERLNLEGFEVYLAADGQEGLMLFEREEFDCVLLDLSMPIMSGNLVFARLKALAPSMPLIVMSGLISDERLATLSPMESSNFLQKPFTGEVLVQMVKTLCEERVFGENSRANLR